MRELARDGMTMVVVTHEMAFARGVADKVVFMDAGVVVESGDPREVIDHPKHERTRSFLRRVHAEEEHRVEAVTALVGMDGSADRDEDDDAQPDRRPGAAPTNTD